MRCTKFNKRSWKIMNKKYIVSYFIFYFSPQAALSDLLQSNWSSNVSNLETQLYWRFAWSHSQMQKIYKKQKTQMSTHEGFAGAAHKYLQQQQLTPQGRHNFNPMIADWYFKPVDSEAVCNIFKNKIVKRQALWCSGSTAEICNSPVAASKPAVSRSLTRQCLKGACSGKMQNTVIK